MSNESISSAKRKKKKGSVASPAFPVAASRELLSIRLFRELSTNAIELLEGKVRRASAEAEETIIELSQESDVFHHFFFITKGQVKIIGFDENAQKRNINFLRKGEFFVDKAILWRGLVSTKVIAITDAELLVIGRDDLKELTHIDPKLEHNLKTLTERVDYRNRLYCEDDYSRSVLDFLVDTALTQASRIKITQMDKCIECNTCYEECEDRHGFQRISRGYAKFGVLDIAKSCLTCFYPTCIPSCPVESVVFDNEKGEVTILDDCIGCQACARACQYGAITIHKVEENDNRFDRFLKSGGKIKPKFIADKCNHCYGYDDLACISNCPTDAIIEISSSDLLENPTIFGVSENYRKPLPSLIQDSWIVGFMQKIYILLTILISGFLIFELVTISKFEHLSLLLRAQASGLISESFQLNFQKGSDFTVLLGNIGFTMIVVAMLYPLRKAFPGLFKYLGKKPLWLDLHNFCGFLGTVLVLFHTGFEFSLHFGTLGMMALCFVMLTGLFGRFLYQTIPRGVAGTELRVKDIENEDIELSKKLDAIFSGSEGYKKIVDEIVLKTTQDAMKKPSLIALFKSVVLSQLMLWKLRFQLPEDMQQYKRYMGTFFKLIKEKVRLRRNVAFLEFSSRLFVKWQYVHKPVAYVMGLLAIAHVIWNLVFFSWNA